MRKLLVCAQVPMTAAIREQLQVESYADVISSTVNVTKWAAKEPNALPGFEIHERNEIFPLFGRDHERWIEEESPSTVMISGGLVCANASTARAVLQFISELDPSAGPWFVSSSRAESDRQSIEMPRKISDFGAVLADFDFELLVTQPRFFNTLEFTGSIVRKHSRWPEKASAEAAFFKQIPPTLARFFPTFVGEVENDRGFVYEIEQKRMFDLGRHAIQDSLGQSDWKNFALNLNEYLNALPHLNVGADKVRALKRAYFIQKLRNRYQEFVSLPISERLARRFRDDIGVEFAERVEQLCSQLEEVILKQDNTYLSFSHGDLCLSNILFDRKASTICLIDPRGVDEAEGLFRPQEYDLAKLAHSLIGGYEFILNDRSPSPNWLKNAKTFFHDIVAKRSVDADGMFFYMSSLFWSLLPLHSECEDLVYRFMLAGETSFQSALSCPMST